jgi:hypothetical protein
MLISWAFLQCFPRTYWVFGLCNTLQLLRKKPVFGLFLFFNQGITLGLEMAFNFPCAVSAAAS